MKLLPIIAVVLLSIVIVAMPVSARSAKVKVWTVSMPYETNGMLSVFGMFPTFEATDFVYENPNLPGYAIIHAEAGHIKESATLETDSGMPWFGTLMAGEMTLEAEDLKFWFKSNTPIVGDLFYIVDVSAAKALMTISYHKPTYVGDEYFVLTAALTEDVNVHIPDPEKFIGGVIPKASWWYDYSGPALTVSVILTQPHLPPPTVKAGVYLEKPDIIRLEYGAQPGAQGLSITRITCDWGDGKVEDIKFPPDPTYHQYNVSGTYTITLTAYQNDIESQTATFTVTVDVTIPP